MKWFFSVIGFILKDQVQAAQLDFHRNGIKKITMLWHFPIFMFSVISF